MGVSGGNPQSSWLPTGNCDLFTNRHGLPSARGGERLLWIRQSRSPPVRLLEGNGLLVKTILEKKWIAATGDGK